MRRIVVVTMSAAIISTLGCASMSLSLFHEPAIKKADPGMVAYFQDRQPENCQWVIGKKSSPTDDRLFLCCPHPEGTPPNAPVCWEVEWKEKEHPLHPNWPLAMPNEP